MEKTLYIPRRYPWHITVFVGWDDDYFRDKIGMVIKIRDQSYSSQISNGPYTGSGIQFNCESKEDILKAITLISSYGWKESILKSLQSRRILWSADLEGKSIDFEKFNEGDRKKWVELFSRFEHVNFWEEIRKLGWHELFTDK